MIWYFFILTLLIELPIVLIFFYKEWKAALLIGSLLNLFTWPLLHIFLLNTNVNINVLEAGVAITEAIGYKLLLRCSWKKAFGISISANGASYGAGLLLDHYHLL